MYQNQRFAGSQWPLRTGSNIKRDLRIHNVFSLGGTCL
jgi:hypothetical protein